jgi:hypothetical protein
MFLGVGSVGRRCSRLVGEIRAWPCGCDIISILQQTHLTAVSLFADRVRPIWWANIDGPVINAVFSTKDPDRSRLLVPSRVVY